MKCPNCHKVREFKSATFERSVRVPPIRFLVEMPAQRCPSCKTFVLTDAVVRNAELEIASRLAEAGPISGASFRLLRSAARLRAVEVARLLGVAKETISRWESGKRGVEPLAWKLLAWIAVERQGGHATTQHRLENFLLAKPLKGTVRLTVAVNDDSAVESDTDAETAAEGERAYVLRDE